MIIVAELENHNKKPCHDSGTLLCLPLSLLFWHEGFRKKSCAFANSTAPLIPNPNPRSRQCAPAPSRPPSASEGAPPSSRPAQESTLWQAGHASNGRDTFGLPEETQSRRAHGGRTDGDYYCMDIIYYLFQKCWQLQSIARLRELYASLVNNRSRGIYHCSFQTILSSLLIPDSNQSQARTPSLFWHRIYQPVNL